MNPLLALRDLGQSVWLDYLRRALVKDGGLRRLIEQDGLGGVTSNPSIFEQAIGQTHEYDSQLHSPELRDLNPKSRYERLAVQDIQEAADLLSGVYRETDRRDGYVSLEVAPDLARDTDGTIAEAHRLWKLVARDNLMIKVPGTPEGVPAIRQLTSEGINVNVTLLFSQTAYRRAAEAYLQGLEQRLRGGGDVAGVAGVASFFVSRIDTAVDRVIDERLKRPGDTAVVRRLRSLRGRVAIANARQAYQMYLDSLRQDRWRALAARGAQPQRLLWASTGTKNPAYRDVVYVEELIGPDTINTMPPATLEAFRNHGRVRVTLTEDVEDAGKTMDALEECGVSLSRMTNDLLEQGIRQFADAFAALLRACDAAAAREAA